MNNQAYDVAVVGSGAAGLTAACVAASMGQKVVVIEQSPYVGGTSAISGGMLWIPGHPYLAQNGLKDSPQNVRQYLENFIAKPFDARMEAFLAHCSPALQYLEKHTHLRTRPVTGYPDYYSELDGASIGCRVLEPEPFDGKLLGKHFHLLRAPLPEFMVFGGMMVSRQDIPLLRKARQGKSLTAVFNAASLVFEYLTQRIFHPRGTRLYLGNALVARLFKSALDLNIDFLLNASAKEIIFYSGNITGIIVKEDNNDKKINVAKGVILATGGLSHDHTLRNQYFSEIDSFKSATISRGDSLSGAKIAMVANAKISDNGKNGVFGVPLSHYVRPDGSEVYYPHTVTDRSKPGLIAVNAVGRRFTNEARSYHDFYYSQLEKENNACPAYLLVDSHFIWKYGLGCIKPFEKNIDHALANGYLIQGQTLEEMEVNLSIPEGELVKTVKTYNLHARLGKDPYFSKGETAYEKYLGDSDNPMNPCVAPVEFAPYYAVRVYPGDLGMSSGIETNENAQVMNQQGKPIDGLYACGNDMSSVMQGNYPGPGITLGPALTFGYLAAQHCSLRM